MSKFKIEHGASKVRLVVLKTNIEDTISQDIDALATWSNNDRKFIVNELLRFALLQDEEFQKHKASSALGTAQVLSDPKSGPGPVKSGPEIAPKSDVAHL